MSSTKQFNIEIIFNSKIDYANKSNIIVAKFQSGKCKTLYARVFDITSTGCYEGVEYSVVFFNKTYCLSVFIYVKDGVLQKDETWAHTEVYNKKDKKWDNTKMKWYKAKDIEIIETIQKRLDDDE